MKGRQVDPGLTGNYGFMDQRAAMKFIHDNIAVFGGNPKSESDPYFQQLIVESNPFTLPYQTTFSSSLLADVTAELLDCPHSDLECLRGKPVEDVVAAGNAAGEKIILDLYGPLHLFEPWGPVIDDKEITDNPLNAYRDGKFQNKPVMIGTVTEEGRMYMWESFETKPAKIEVDAFFALIFGVEESFRIFQRYNFTKFDDLREPMSTAATDYVFVCSTLNASRLLSLGSSSNIYHYVFDHALSFPSVWGPNYTECYGHVCHGSELPFVWRSVSLRNYKFTKEEQQLAESITNYWGNFAHTGDPNDDSWKDESKRKQDFIKWPTYDKNTGWQGMLFQSSGNKVQSKYREPFCRFLDDIGYTPK
ncbi:crystal protein-like [Amphiura filiformis]|uniref:crystal protein-like n=1 Tax=Amphiura filiformis TaxID=82378 RepID=UPI003B2229ED